MEKANGVKESRKSKVLLCVMWGVLALMFWLDILANIIGVTMGHLKFSPMAVSFGLVMAGIFTVLAVMQYMKVRKSDKN